MYDHETGEKYLTVDELIKALSGLPKDLLVTPNTVGNLLLKNQDGYVGFIDFVDGAVETFDEPQL